MSRPRQILSITGFALALVVFQGISASAETLTDNFTTNPFTSSPRRWCERWHHIHWSSQRMSGSNSLGAGGPPCTDAETCCPSPDSNGCCAVCPTNGCVNAGLAGHSMITQGTTPLLGKV